MKTTAVCFVLIVLFTHFAPQAQCLSPAPDGGYPNLTTAEGTNALLNLTTGGANTAIGWYSLFSAGPANYNTGVGAGALALNTGDSNTAVGAAALLLNTTGDQNTGVGIGALLNNSTGAANSAFGTFALRDNTTGGSNTAIGFSALGLNTIGAANTATGLAALASNSTGTTNTASGYFALSTNSSGESNTANGVDALSDNSSGNNNTADGGVALSNNTTGNNNTALGFEAGANVTTANNVTCIGADMVGANVSNSTWIGNVFGVTTQSGTTAPVVVSNGGQLGTLASSERFKKDIATMENASEAILSLRPVTFHYKTDSKSTPQFGLVAEEVAKINAALVLPDKEGKPYTVRYDAVNAMLLNEFLKEHRAFVQEQAKVERLEKQLAALTAAVQKVSAQLETSGSPPQMAKND